MSTAENPLRDDQPESTLSPDTSSAKSVAAVVVNHNAGDHLISCVASLRSAGVDEIVVVDNASGDGSLARLAASDPNVVMLPTGANLGYGSGANRGVERTTAEFVLICNPDLLVGTDVPSVLAAELREMSDVAVLGPRIVESNGETYPSARAFPQLTDAVGHAFVGLFQPNNPWSRRYRTEASASETEGDVDWVSGACMLVRRIAFSSVGGFDEGYFMYVEDLDLCWRLRRSGWRTRYVPSVAVVHERGASSKEHPYRLLIAHHESTWRFARKSMSASQRALLPAAGLAIAARLVLALGRTFLGDRAAKRSVLPPEVG